MAEHGYGGGGIGPADRSSRAESFFHRSYPQSGWRLAEYPDQGTQAGGAPGSEGSLGGGSARGVDGVSASGGRGGVGASGGSVADVARDAGEVSARGAG